MSSHFLDYLPAELLRLLQQYLIASQFSRLLNSSKKLFHEFKNEVNIKKSISGNIVDYIRTSNLLKVEDFALSLEDVIEKYQYDPNWISFIRSPRSFALTKSAVQKVIYLDHHITTVKLTDCVHLSDISGLSSVQKLEIHNCKSICDLSPLKNLRILRINMHASYAPSPIDINCLSKLIQLELLGCSSISDISELGYIPYLTIDNCRNIKVWPTAFNNRRLIILNCTEFDFATTIINVKFFQTDSHVMVNVRYENLGLCNSSTLETLNIRFHGQIAPQFPPNLKNLTIRYFAFPPPKEFASLQSLSLWNCKQVKELDYIYQIPKITLVQCHKVKAKHLEIFERLPAYSPELIRREISFIEMYEIHEFNHLQCFYKVSIISCTLVKSIKDIPPNTTQELIIKKCRRLKQIANLQGMKYLEVNSCDSLSPFSFTNVTKIHSFILKAENPGFQSNLASNISGKVNEYEKIGLSTAFYFEAKELKREVNTLKYYNVVHRDKLIMFL
jgi:hypothetical protein